MTKLCCIVIYYTLEFRSLLILLFCLIIWSILALLSPSYTSTFRVCCIWVYFLLVKQFFFVSPILSCFLKKFKNSFTEKKHWNLIYWSQYIGLHRIQVEYDFPLQSEICNIGYLYPEIFQNIMMVKTLYLWVWLSAEGVKNVSWNWF